MAASSNRRLTKDLKVKMSEVEVEEDQEREQGITPIDETLPKITPPPHSNSLISLHMTEKSDEVLGTSPVLQMYPTDSDKDKKLQDKQLTLSPVSYSHTNSNSTSSNRSNSNLSLSENMKENIDKADGLSPGANSINFTSSHSHYNQTFFAD